MARQLGTTPTDETLLERARAGDPDALHTIFDGHQPTLEARIRSLLPPVVQARVSISDVL